MRPRSALLGPTLLAALFATVLAGCAAEPAGEERQPPNILLISIDTLRADRLGAYGNPRDTSPFLDRLAADGVRFRHAFVNTHGTTPSHATLLSSLYQESHRVAWDDGPLGAVPSAVPLLQEALRAAGYLTVGVTGGGNVGRKFGFDRGFDRWNDRSRSVAAGTARLLKLLRQAWTGERPVFAFYHTYQVHSPYLVPEGYERLFGAFDSDFVPTSENLLRHVHTAERTLRRQDLDHILASYDAGIRLTDDALGRLFAKLEARGFLDHALVVVTSDHGEEFAEHGGLLHRDLLFDELLRVPLIVRGPGIGRGIVDPRMVSTVDVAPTILGCAGVAVPPGMEGRDLLCSGASEEHAPSVIAQYGQRRYAVRTAEWKLIVDRDPPAIALYHLPSDPRETVNVAAGNRRIVAELRERLETWRAARGPVGEAPEAPELSPEEIEQLRALGYLGGD